MQLAALCFHMMLGAAAPATTQAGIICGDVGPDWFIATNYLKQQAHDIDLNGQSKAAQVGWEKPCVMLDSNSQWATETKGAKIWAKMPKANGTPSPRFVQMEPNIKVCP